MSLGPSTLDEDSGTRTPVLVPGPTGTVVWFVGSILWVSGFGTVRMTSGEEFLDGDVADSVVPPPMYMAWSGDESR